MPIPGPELPPKDPRHDNAPARPLTTDDPEPVREPLPIDAPPLPAPLEMPQVLSALNRFFNREYDYADPT
jgi:hypothetical protein